MRKMMAENEMFFGVLDANFDNKSNFERFFFFFFSFLFSTNY